MLRPIQRFMKSEDMMGSIPEGWPLDEKSNKGNTIYLYANRERALNDPRLGPMPAEWKIRHGDQIPQGIKLLFLVLEKQDE